MATFFGGKLWQKNLDFFQQHFFSDNIDEKVREYIPFNISTANRVYFEQGVINGVCLPYLSVVGFGGKVQGSYGIKCKLVNVRPCAQELSHHI